MRIAQSVQMAQLTGLGHWHGSCAGNGKRLDDVPSGATICKDVVVMPLKSRLRAATMPRQSRLAAPSCRGGASSLLRLSQPGASRLPSTLDIGGWVRRAGQALKLPAVPAFAPSDFVA